MMRFVDEAKIFVKGGDGGNGCTLIIGARVAPSAGQAGRSLPLNGAVAPGTY